MSVLTHISFDLDHTLFDFDRTLQEALAASAQFLAAEAGLHVSAEALQAKRNALSLTKKGRSLKLLDLRRWAFAHVLDGRSDQDRLVAGAMQAFETARFGQMHLYPEAEAVLRTLSDRYTLAAITNGNTDPEATALAGLFETTVFAEDCGYRKPDARIFELLMGRLGIDDPRSVLHVGDGLETDVGGANAFGFATVWFNPGRVRNTTGIVPRYEVASLSELPQIAAQHAAGSEAS